MALVARSEIISSDRTAASVDAVDRRLLELLSADPRMSVRALARAISMSPSAVGERLDRLTKRGVIRGFRLEIDPAALGYALEAEVAIRLRKGKPMADTVNALTSIPEVRTVRLVTGRWDLLLSVLVRDSAHLREVLYDRLWSVADVHDSESMIVMHTWSCDGPLASRDRQTTSAEP